MPKVIGIVGTRRRDSDEDLRAVEAAFLDVYEPGDIICSGLCPKGADRFAVLLAEKHGTPTKWHPAEWEKFGRAAGFIRNTYIANDADVLIACVASDRKGGTEDTIRKFKRQGKAHLIII